MHNHNDQTIDRDGSAMLVLLFLLVSTMFDFLPNIYYPYKVDQR